MLAKSGAILLVSVRDAAEAKIALAAGANIVDVKEPSRGSLGAADDEVIRQVDISIRDSAVTSVACGELLTDKGPDPKGFGKSIKFAKVGLSGCCENAEWIGLWKHWGLSLPAWVKPVAVVYADWQRAQSPPAANIISVAKAMGSPGVLIDTYDKSAGSLFESRKIDEVADWTRRGHDAGLFVALAGSLDRQSVPLAIALGADIIAVRGAACGGQRDAPIKTHDVRQLAQMIRMGPAATTVRRQCKTGAK